MFKSLFVTLIASNSLLFADAALGEKLERAMWEDMKHRNYTAVESNIADQFQSIHTFGALTREAEIDLIKNLYLGNYEISDFKGVENEDTIVVSYLISVKEKIDDKNLSEKPAPRLSVWKKINGKWQWIAHANLKDIPQSLPKPVTK
ncbi:MAG: nuclear transport factor 2 family protein [Parachlamydiaceae bacterium]